MQTMQNPFLGQQRQEFLEIKNALEPGHTQGRRRSAFSAWLKLIQERNEGLRALFVDPHMRVRLTIPENHNQFGPIAQEFALEALRTNHVVMSDLHHSRFTEKIHGDLAIPIRAEGLSPEAAASSTNAATSPVIAVVDIEVDPYKSLYPRLQTWPTPVPAAKLLLRRETDKTVLLNELRHVPEMALGRELFMNKAPTFLPSRQLSDKGIIETNDYRGVPVVACMRTIPDTPWFLVVKMDQAEIYALFREQTWVSTVLVIAYIILGAVSMDLLTAPQQPLAARATGQRSSDHPAHGILARPQSHGRSATGLHNRQGR